MRCSDCGAKWEVYAPPYPGRDGVLHHICKGRKRFAGASTVLGGTQMCLASKEMSRRNAESYLENGRFPEEGKLMLFKNKTPPGALKPLETPGYYRDDKTGAVLHIASWSHHNETLVPDTIGFSHYWLEPVGPKPRVILGWHFVVPNEQALRNRITPQARARIEVSDCIVATDSILSLVITDAVDKMLVETRERMDRLEREMRALRHALENSRRPAPEEPLVDYYPGSLTAPILVRRGEKLRVTLHDVPANVRIGVVLRGLVSEPVR